MSRNLRLIFAATTMLGAVAVAPNASAKVVFVPKFTQPKQAMPKPAPKILGIKVLGIKIPPKVGGPLGIKIPPTKVTGPIFIQPIKVKVPVFIPPSKLHPPIIIRWGGGYRPYAPGYPVSYAGTPGQSQSAPAAAATTTYQALGLAWNHDGAWTVEQAATLEEAGANALAKCNAQYGGCEISTLSVSEQTLGCLAVARGAEDTHRLFAARAKSADDVQANVLRSISDAGTSGNVEYAACNASS